MELRHLRSFIAAAETGRLSLAADRVGKSVQAMGRHLLDLEAELGAALLDWVGDDDLRLTPAGESFFQDCRRIVSGLDAARTEVRDIADGRSGTFDLGLCEEAATPWLASVIRDFRDRLPALTFRIFETPSEGLATALRRHKVDLALMLPNVDDTGLVVQPLWSENWVLVSPPGVELPDRVIASEDLAGQPLILSHPQYGACGHDAIREAFAVNTLLPNVAAQALGRSMMLALSTIGVGYTFVPQSYAESRPGTPGRSMRTFQARPMTIAAAYRSEDPPGVAMQFLRTIRAARAAYEAG